MLAIETRSLVKSYGNKRVVCDFDMKVPRGSIYGFVGKNGAGKSTVMRMIDGLASPDSGAIVIFGRDVTCGTQLSQSHAIDEGLRIGALINEPGLLLNLSAQENLMAKAYALGIPHAKSCVQETLKLVGLADCGKKRAKKFSQGMKQRLGIALALMGSPDLLLLDEPFNGLDPEGTREMRLLIKKMNEVRGITVVISSHVLDQLDRMATHFGVIAQGHMVTQMSAEEMRAQCSKSLSVRTTAPERTLALLEQSLPDAVIRMLPGGTIRIGGELDAGRVADLLRSDSVCEKGATILEFTENKCDIEEYFIKLMEGLVPSPEDVHERGVESC